MRSVKKMLPLYLISLVFVTAAAYAASAGISAYAVLTEASVQSAFPVVILDPGHGGEDGGAVSPSGVKESDLNLEIALRLRDLLRFLGLPVEMTRETDISIHSPDAQSISEKKVSDLKNRVEFAERHERAILISIHQNMFSEAKYRGCQLFYASSGPSRELAERLQAQVGQKLDASNHRQAKECRTVYLLNKLHCPAVLVECGFLSNPQEEQLLQSSGYQKKLAAVLAAELSETVADMDLY